MTNVENVNIKTGLEIAVIGMAGRFPGARTIAQFWENLVNGIETIAFFSDEELQETGIDPSLLSETDYVKAKGNIPEIDYFDAAFFNYTPREAQLMDPQIRVLHECTWEALEDAGYNPGTYEEAIGMYVGASFNFKWLSTAGISGSQEGLGAMDGGVLGYKDAIGTLISYKLDLRGPCYTLTTACSTSLVAIHVACRSLLTGECTIALAGGVTALYPNKSGYLYQEGLTLSPDGHCRAFDAAGAGIVFGDGAGIVVLKRLDQAIADGDNIHALVKGSAINNDGARKAGYTAPSVEGQADAIRAAIHMAEVEVESISYIETHGTATQVGDPIEIKALKRVFNTGKKAYCAIGSVKSNIGHLDSAAGVTGFIKTVMALKHRLIPPTIHFVQPNPEIDFINSAFYVSTEPAKWNSWGYPLRAGVSSFGYGGTNAHVILEEWPVGAGCRTPEEECGPPQLLILSAKTESALDQLTENLVDYVKKNLSQPPNPIFTLADMIYTLQVGRKPFKYRRMAVVSSLTGVVDTLSPLNPGKIQTYSVIEENTAPVFIFSGQGTPYINMGLELFQKEPVFRRQLDHCFKILQPLMDYNIIESLYPPVGGARSISPASLNGENTRSGKARPILFAFEYALAKLLLEWGIKPSAMLGDDLGEYIAACLAGVFSLEDAIILSHYTNVTGQARDVEERAKKIKFNAPGIPFISSVTGHWISRAQVFDYRYWLRRSPADPLAWVKGMQELIKRKDSPWVEVGVNHNFQSWVMQTIGEPPPPCIPGLVKKAGESLSDQCYLLQRVGELWLNGVNVRWSAFHTSANRRRISLPTYPFEKQCYRPAAATLPGKNKKAGADSQLKKKPDIADWFYIPTWKQSPLISGGPTDPTIKTTWLIFMDSNSLGESLSKEFEKAGDKIIRVLSGSEFFAETTRRYTLKPDRQADYNDLFEELASHRCLPDHILHLWGVTGSMGGEISLETIEKSMDLGFYSLLYLAKSMAKHYFNKSLNISVITDHARKVTGRENLNPAKAAVEGLCKVIPQEFSFVHCRGIDIDPLDSEAWQGETSCRLLAAELRSGATDMVAAYRNDIRWIQCFDPVHIDKSLEHCSRLRKRGIYWITGGLGSVGMILAEYLARQENARLILTGRSAFPKPGEWEQWLTTHSSGDPTSRKIRKLIELEKLGAEVLVESVDVTDHVRMSQLLTQVQQRWGCLNGVIHAAGTMGETMCRSVEEVDKTQCQMQFNPKMAGMLVIEKLLEGIPLDFCFFMSSISTVLGGLGLAAYSAANIFMDTFVKRHNRKSSTPWLTVNWEEWPITEERRAAALRRSFQFEPNTPLEMTPVEAQTAFQRVLLWGGFEHIIHFPGDLQTMMDRWTQPSDFTLRQTPLDLLNNYSLAGDQWENAISETWKLFFGLPQVGMDDNLFDIGATSLDVIQINAMLRRILKRNIPILEIFNHPTIRSLARYLRDDKAPPTPGKQNMTKERLEKGRSSVQSRRELRQKRKENE